MKPRNNIELGPLRIEDPVKLTQLSLRAKQSWGYSGQFMSNCEELLGFDASPFEHPENLCIVARNPSRIAGFATLIKTSLRVTELDDFFVDPVFQGFGVGKQLFHAVADAARTQGMSLIEITSDPFAEGFYASMGCYRVGYSKASAVENRLLPVLNLLL
ncbi:MAG: GNAT family N-acetyltransferase [Pseudomonadota bacterium]